MGASYTREITVYASICFIFEINVIWYKTIRHNNLILDWLNKNFSVGLLVLAKLAKYVAEHL